MIAFDGPTITGTISTTYTDLRYRYAWGDCMAGCIYSRYWRFRVYNDCSVEYMGSYGSPNPPIPQAIKQNASNPAIEVFPNPVRDKLILKEINETDVISIYNGLGQTILKRSGESEIDVEVLAPGIYYLKIRSMGIEKAVKFVKD